MPVIALRQISYFGDSIKMKNVNDIRADILAAMQAAAEPESGDLNKSAEQVLADAIEGYLTASTATASKSAPKAKTIKEKGIALCHQATRL
ncbi:hypothetical protein OH690_09765 [Escherichia coli]|nr:hypothetical protein [Escherichia coli]